MTPSSPPLPPLPGGAGPALRPARSTPARRRTVRAAAIATDPARADLGAEDRPFVGLATARAIAGVGP